MGPKKTTIADALFTHSQQKVLSRIGAGAAPKTMPSCGGRWMARRFSCWVMRISSDNLERLARIAKLKREAPDRREFLGLVHSGRVRLADAKRSDLSAESRFDLAYNAAHVLALAAVRWHG